MPQLAASALTLLGALGIGLVWGWLMGLWSFPARRVWYTLFVILLATCGMGAAIFFTAHWQAVLVFLVGAGLSLFTHLVWRRDLAARYPSIPPGGKS